MTYAEYHEKKIALLASYLHLAVASEARREEVTTLAWGLADALDKLALEIDPFAMGTGKSDTLLKAKPGGT